VRANPRLNRQSRRPTGASVASLAEALGVSRQSINELLRERRSVSPEMALRLSRLFSNSPEFWRNAQRAVAMWEHRGNRWQRGPNDPDPRLCTTLTRAAKVYDSEGNEVDDG
jgi:addiction module HigA family antidote